MKPPQETKDKPKRTIHVGWALLGGFITLFSVGCIAIEVTRNYLFGAKGVHVPADAIIAGCSVAIFAVMLLILPLLTSRGGAKPMLRLLYAFSMAVTFYCGVAYYVDDIRGRMREADRVTREFEDRQREREAAEAERTDARAEQRRLQAVADAIPENTPSAALKELADKAEENARAEATDKKRGASCGEKCRAHEGKRDEYRQRLPQALAKEAAQKRADEARARADAAQKRIDLVDGVTGSGPAEASGMAGLAADVIGINAMTYQGWEGLVTPIAKVIGLLGGAGLLPHGLALLLFGLGVQGREALAAPAPAPRGLEVVPPPAKPSLVKQAATLLTGPKPDGEKRGRKPLTPEERVKKFVSEMLVVGEGAMAGDEMTDTFNRWWHERWPNERPMRPRDFSPILTKAGVERRRIAGKSRYIAKVLSC